MAAVQPRASLLVSDNVEFASSLAPKVFSYLGMVLAVTSSTHLRASSLLHSLGCLGVCLAIFSMNWLGLFALTLDFFHLRTPLPAQGYA